MKRMVEGLVCVCCAEAIEAAVASTPGVEVTRLDAELSRLSVAYDPAEVDESLEADLHE